MDSISLFLLHGLLHVTELTTNDVATGSASPDVFIAVNNTTDFLSSRFTIILGFLSVLAGAAAMVYLILNAMKYMRAAGDSKKTEEARKGIIAVVVGIILLVTVNLIVQLAQSTGQTAVNVSQGNALNIN
jgi:hypothetical protein